MTENRDQTPQNQTQNWVLQASAEAGNPCQSHPAYQADYCPSCGTSPVLGQAEIYLRTYSPSQDLLDSFGLDSREAPAGGWTWQELEAQEGAEVFYRALDLGEIRKGSPAPGWQPLDLDPETLEALEAALQTWQAGGPWQGPSPAPQETYPGPDLILALGLDQGTGSGPEGTWTWADLRLQSGTLLVRLSVQTDQGVGMIRVVRLPLDLQTLTLVLESLDRGL